MFQPVFLALSHFTSQHSKLACLLKRCSDGGPGNNFFFGLFFFGMNNGTLSVSSNEHGLQLPKHLNGLSSVCGFSLIMGNPDTGHSTLDMSLCYGEKNNDIF